VNVIQLGDARELPFKDGYFGLALFSPPWDNLGIVDEAKPEIMRVLKKRGRWAMVLPNTLERAALVLANRDLTEKVSYGIPKPRDVVGPVYFSVDEKVVHWVLDQMPWVKRVLDPFCGAGTVIKVARERGLEAYGVDIDPAAVKVAQGRV
jgi:SAM-dependent methyltransferase